MKNLIFTMMLAVLASCSTDDDSLVGRVQGQITLNDDSIKIHRVINFGLSGFDMSQQAMTRSTLTELEMSDLWVFDYVGDELKQTIHQTSDLTSVTLSLEYGQHDFYFVASRGTTPSVVAPVISWEKPSDTFWATMSLDVQPTTAAAQNVAMSRVATRMRVIPTDVLPENAAKLSVTPSHWYYGINAKTGEGADDRSTERTINIPSNYVGTSGTLAASFFGLSGATEWTTDVLVKMMDANDAVIGSVSVPDVSFKRNRVTIFSGGVLNAGKSFNITADGEWLDDHQQTW